MIEEVIILQFLFSFSIVVCNKFLSLGLTKLTITLDNLICQIFLLTFLYFFKMAGQ